ncbi:MAG: prenyltransferase/squalene oxidase repeat-containing protein [Aeoliella sp.]
MSDINATPPYLVELTLRLAAGVERLPQTERSLHGQLFCSRQCEDGGFSGRDGQSDLYYTAFALRGLVMLGELEPGVAESAAAYLRRRMQGNASLIDLISLVFAARLLEASTGIELFNQGYAGWSTKLAETFETLRRPDGGYAKSVEGHASSTYQTFLIALAYELMESTLPNAERACEFVLSQQREDGGFVEIGVMRRSGTNPTAAAIGTLRVLGEQFLTAEVRSSVAQFLLESATEEGGFRANTQIPIADLLSTFTALETLRDVGAWDAVGTQRTLAFVSSLQGDHGGFRAAVWDDVVDVEYSFYGLASLGLLLGDSS